MRTSHGFAVIFAAGVVALTAVACSGTSSGGQHNGTGSSASVSVTRHPTEVAGIPARPTGTELSSLETALHRIDPQVFTNEGATIDKARDQCHDLNDGVNNPDAAAQQRFSTSGHQLTLDQARQINDVLRQKLC
ncbi:hypothetical protein ACFV1W_37280 [Kitasatospora sp. NPDC059648]|uniref:hypothetical protein n=1 Tax=Kitasatospora sp. NPDC059648 TaxID=3346894 RepID=UPI00367ECDD1